MRQIAARSAVVGAVLAGSVALTATPAAAQTERLTVLGVEITTVGTLHPGGTADLAVTVSNPNRHGVTITDIVADLIDSDVAGCDSATGVRFLDRHDLATPLAAGARTTITLPAALTMANDSDADCAGATFAIPLVVTASGTADLTVADSAPVTLPKTGDPTTLIAGTGMLLVAAGTVLVARARRRTP